MGVVGRARRCRRSHLAILWALVLLPTAGHAAGDSLERPKVGLALGGGGARGLAHIGVLQWLEERRIPVDYIAGTSMGGLIAGMYAMGYTPEQMREMMTGMDWDVLLSGSPTYQTETFRRKQDRRDYRTAFEAGFKDGFSLPPGIIAGHYVSMLFSGLAMPFAAVESFDALPIPFRCIATDLVTAQPVILDSGSLPEAMRATMAIPGVFTPVRRGDQVLADGALLNNVPTQVLKDLGADLIIAVDVGTPLGSEEAVSSLIGVLTQSVGVMIIQNVRESLSIADFVLIPTLRGFSSTEYKRAAEIIRRGYAVAQGKTVALSPLALGAEAWDEHLAARRARMPGPLPAIGHLAVGGPSGPAARHIEARLADHLGQPFDRHRVERDLNDIYGEGRHSRISYQGSFVGGSLGLHVLPTEQPHAPPKLDVGLAVSGGTSAAARFGLRARMTAMDLLRFGDEWRLEGQVGNNAFLRTEYYRPFGSTRGLFYAPRVHLTHRTVGLHQDGKRLADYVTDEYGLAFDLGYTPSRSSELRLGLDWGNIESTVHVGVPLLPDLRDRYFRVSARFEYDGVDQPIIPTSGFRASLGFDTYLRVAGGDSQFKRFDSLVSYHLPVGRRDTTFWRLQAGTTFDQTAPAHADFTIGGPLQLSAHERGEFRGSHYLLGAAGYLRQVATFDSILGGRVYAGSWYEFGGAFARFDHARYRHSLSAGLLAETFLGPVAVAGSFGEEGAKQVYFAVGDAF